MPAVIVDSSVLTSLVAGEQFHLLHDFFGTIYLPPAVLNEVATSPKPFGRFEVSQAQNAGWLLVREPVSVATIRQLPFNLQAGETEALALALEMPGSLLLVDDAQGRRAAKALNIEYTGTLGVLLRAKEEGKIPALRPVLELLQQRTTFWLSQPVYQAVLSQAGESS